mmetsp:Transcript_16501/g.36945  ORF Transcript_16501/g.36945 Transcript_16501/m.36945 type:complete len:81 (-) Transcript_16501:154-396(-)
MSPSDELANELATNSKIWSLDPVEPTSMIILNGEAVLLVGIMRNCPRIIRSIGRMQLQEYEECKYPEHADDPGGSSSRTS